MMLVDERRQAIGLIPLATAGRKVGRPAMLVCACDFERFEKLIETRLISLVRHDQCLE